MSAKIVKIVVAVAFIALLLKMSGAFHHPSIQPKKLAQDTGLEAPEHQLRVTLQSHATYTNAVGTVVAISEVHLAAEVGGRLLSTAVNVGDSVSAGQTLAQLDSRDAQSRRDQARSSLISAQAAAQQTAASLQRYTKLFQQEAATAAQMESVEAADAQAKASVQLAQDRLTQTELHLGFAKIQSPVSGVVLERFIDPGDLITPGMPLMVIQGIDGFELAASVRESLFPHIEIGQQVIVVLDALEREQPAVISEIRPAADPQTRSLLIKASLPDSTKLRAGMYGILRIPSGDAKRLLVPQIAVHRIGQLQMLVVRGEDQRWTQRYVRCGSIFDDAIEILSGIESGDVIGWSE